MTSDLRLSACLRVAVLENPHPKLADWLPSRPVDADRVNAPRLRAVSIEAVREELTRQGLHFREIPEHLSSLWPEAEKLLADVPEHPPLPMLLIAPADFRSRAYTQERRELANAGIFVVRMGSAELRELLSGSVSSPARDAT